MTWVLSPISARRTAAREAAAASNTARSPRAAGLGPHDEAALELLVPGAAKDVAEEDERALAVGGEPDPRRLAGQHHVGAGVEVGHVEPVGHVERIDLDHDRLAFLEDDLLLRVLEALDGELDDPFLGRRRLGGGKRAAAERKAPGEAEHERRAEPRAPVRSRRHAAPRLASGSSSIATFRPLSSSSTSRKPRPR